MPLAIEMKKARGGFIVADVMLDAERSLNALNQEMAKELRARINEWQNDKNVCAVFLRGAGERAFCAEGIFAEFTGRFPSAISPPPILISPTNTRWILPCIIFPSP